MDKLYVEANEFPLFETPAPATGRRGALSRISARPCVILLLLLSEYLFMKLPNLGTNKA